MNSIRVAACALRNEQAVRAHRPSTKKTWRDSLPIDMLLSAVSVLVVAQSSSEIPEGLMNNPVFVVTLMDLEDLERRLFIVISHFICGSFDNIVTNSNCFLS